MTNNWVHSTRPVDFGWEGLLNKIRKVLGRPQTMMDVFSMKLDQPITLQQGQSAEFIIPLGRVE